MKKTDDHGSRTNDTENSRDDEHLLVVTRLLHVNTSEKTGSGSKDCVGNEVKTCVGRGRLLDGGEVEGNLVDDSEPVWTCQYRMQRGDQTREVTH